MFSCALFLGGAFFTFAAQQDEASKMPGSLDEIRAQLESKPFTESEKALRSYLEQHVASGDGHFLLGYVLFRENHPKESLAEFTNGAKFQKLQASDLKIVAADYVLLDDFADADKWLTNVTSEIPQDANAWYLLGRTKYNENRFAEAIDCFRKALSLRPKDIKAENNLGLAHQGLNQIDAARTAFETAISWQKDALQKDAQPYLNLGILFLDQGQAAQSVQLLEEAAMLAPHNPKAHEQLGRAYEQLDQMEKAQHELEAAVALAPNASGLHFKLGQIYRRRQMKQQAQQQFEICAKLNSNHSSGETPNPATQQ
jgi:Flp pilus assembly protein TadD